MTLTSPASAGRSLSVPISTATPADESQGFPMFTMKWDEGSQPDPLSLRWGRSQVPVRGAGMAAIPEAFRFALDRLAPTIRPTGILSLYANFTGPSRGEESDASVALAVGFLAILKGDRLLQDVTVTGTLTPSGEIGPVTQVAEKAKAAARAGYRMLLVPRGQFYAPRVNLAYLRSESKLLVYEVGTIDEAYELMTGKKL
ncbi:MAG: hypothetical protein KF814_03405 [Nitrospiraceae bacterium]|nr:hypothetical protein [Nitrospiraceae bacterium]